MRLSDILFTAASILGFFSSTVQGHSLISEDGLHQLKAAHKYHELSKRGGGIHPLFEVELVYAEGKPCTADSLQGTRLTLCIRRE